MERQDLMGPFDLHLQWFGEEGAGGEGAAGGEGEGGGKPAGEGAGAGGNPAEKPPAKPEPELKADGTFFAQASDKFKKDPKILKDILGGEKPLKSWDGVLERMYSAETRAKELEGKVAPAPTKPEEYEFEELKFPDHLAGDEHKDLRDNLSAYIKAQDDVLRVDGIKDGLSKDAVKRESNRMRERVFAQQKASADQYASEREAGLKALKEAWKGDFEARQDIANRAILTFGKDKLVAKLAKRGLENDPEIIETFYEIGTKIGEGHLVPGKPGPAQPTPQEKKAVAMKNRYKNSPELTGGPAPGDRPVDQAALDRLAKRFPKQAAEAAKK